MPLTDAKCKNARPTDKPYKLADGGGLYLLVVKTGSRLWRLDFRHDGKRQTMALGAYPQMSLIEAREGREKARKLLRDGENPMRERRVARTIKALANANTFGLVADELLEKLTRKSGRKSPLINAAGF